MRGKSLTPGVSRREGRSAGGGGGGGYFEIVADFELKVVNRFVFMFFKDLIID